MVNYDVNYKDSMDWSSKDSGNHVVENVIYTVVRREVYKGKLLLPPNQAFMLN